jgi:hypothetical protein
MGVNREGMDIYQMNDKRLEDLRLKYASLRECGASTVQILMSDLSYLLACASSVEILPDDD